MCPAPASFTCDGSNRQRPGTPTRTRYRDVDAVMRRLRLSASPQSKFAAASGTLITPKFLGTADTIQ
jgi:hypothetical protein